MHTVHLATTTDKTNSPPFKYAAMGIMFSVNDYTATNLDDWEIEIIDNFFESFQWDKYLEKDGYVDKVEYGDLMTMVDMDNRWVYKGSVTTPPCDRLVYWNVVRKVYPIKEKHLEAFKEQLRNKGKAVDLYKTGNWRLIQATTLAHDVRVIETKKDLRTVGMAAGVVIILVIAILSFFIAVCSWNMYRRRSYNQEGHTELAQQDSAVKRNQLE